ncbi:MAG: tyrosine-type recombinase/integrase [Methanothrix sp.]|nr:site-specific integrase [Methanothrix sp.]MCX8207991.1 tyrosine-type recombinase/integrase [Methanothrix sp.]
MIDLNDFRLDLQLRGLAGKTIYNAVWAARSYLKWCESISKDPLSSDSLLGYLRFLRSDKRLRSNSIQTIFNSLSLWFSYLEDKGEIASNPIPQIRKRYLKSYKDPLNHRKLISIEDAARMVRATIDTRDRAILLLFLKTGIRRNELISLDVDDVDLENMSILLKSTPKRSNRIVYFDEETARALKRWLSVRSSRPKRRGERALFLNRFGTRIHADSVLRAVTQAAERVGLHDPKSDRPEDRFSPHCCRHWFTTHLIRSGMPRDYIKWLRGDSIHEAIDIYNHIDPEDVKRSYMAHIPMLGV